jgi:predicted amidohydrolase
LSSIGFCPSLSIEGKEASLVSGMVNIVLAQLSPRLRETEVNLETMRRIVAEHPEADLIIFPELFLSGYTLTHIDELAIGPDGPELKSAADMAREHSTTLIFGAPERVSGGIANSAFCVDGQGAIAGVYRKVQLYGGEESDAFVAGDELIVVEMCGLKVGIMICFDVEFPEVARALARAGAELLVTISANMEPFGNDHAVFVSARALENGLLHTYVNQVGPGEKNLTFTGGSAVVSPDGEICAQGGSSEEAIISVRPLLPARSNLREDYLSELRSPMPSVKTATSSARP